MVDRFSDGLLTPTETASHLQVPLSTLTGWLRETAAGTPLVHHVGPVRKGQPSVSFIGLAEAHVLRSLRQFGLRRGEIQEIAAAVRNAFDTPYGLVSKRIATDGVDIFGEHGHELVAMHLQYLTWEGDEDYPTSLRLKQYGELTPVVIDPRFGHGLPVIAANRVTVRAVTDLRNAGERIEDIAYEYDMTPEQVDSLCQGGTL
jgi:uncharacterized protein (DUF433 family)